jgi:hypothetical protein
MCSSLYHRAGFQVTHNNLLTFKQSRLDLIEITRETPTTFRCDVITQQETISETISFRIKGNDLFSLSLNSNEF